MLPVLMMSWGPTRLESSGRTAAIGSYQHFRQHSPSNAGCLSTRLHKGTYLVWQIAQQCASSAAGRVDNAASWDDNEEDDDEDEDDDEEEGDDDVEPVEPV